jgi:2-polyprenyl-3-methyl-5-hydroxy-6-metoxy-1,4-benzoquinol methylase
MLRISKISQQSTVDVLDLACGGGIITSSLLNIASQQPSLKIERILAGDIDKKMLEYVTARRESAIAAGEISSWSAVHVERMD